MRVFLMAFVLSAAALLSSLQAASASMCLCTFTNGHSECLNLSATECRRVDDSLIDASCYWSAAGMCPSVKPRYMSRALKSRAIGPQYTMYFKWFSYRERPDGFVQFRGGPALENACAGDQYADDYRVLKSRVTFKSSSNRCPNRPGTLYGTVTYQ